MPNSSLIKGKACLTLPLLWAKHPWIFQTGFMGHGCVCVCVCPPGLVQMIIIIIIIINSTYSGPGSVLRAHINPYSNLLNWLLGLSHFTDEEKWDKGLNPECTHFNISCALICLFQPYLFRRQKPFTLSCGKLMFLNLFHMNMCLQLEMCCPD